ncbi:unnamed protein product [Umbelopsis sp. WA50703]
MRQQQLNEQKLREEQEKKLAEEEQAKLAMLASFERTQTSVLPDERRKPATESTESGVHNQSSPNAHAGTKRKFELNSEERQRIVEKEKAEAMKKLKEAKVEEAKAKLPSFWLPSLTPSAETTTEKETDKIQPMCAASQLHPVTIKSLINVLFTHEDGKSGNAICPACMKGLNNGTKISVLRKCGHVICNKCIDSFVRKSQRCYVCEKKTKDKDIVDMSAEGTGFASNSKNLEAKKFDVAFQ